MTANDNELQEPFYLKAPKSQVEKKCDERPACPEIAQAAKMPREKANATSSDFAKFLDPKLTPDFMDLYVVRAAILDAVKTVCPRFHGTFLDVGCGVMPYRSLITSEPANVTRYIGMDLESGIYKAEVDLRWDGKTIPLSTGSVDCAMLTEVLEHVPEPAELLAEVSRVLKRGGLLFFTVPFLWPLQDVPWDYYRYTSFALQKLLTEASFTDIELHALGGWNASLAQMIGLWVKRAPLKPEERKDYAEKLFPLFQVLAETEEDVNPFGNQTMATGWWGVACR